MVRFIGTSRDVLEKYKKKAEMSGEATARPTELKIGEKDPKVRHDLVAPMLNLAAIQKK